MFSVIPRVNSLKRYSFGRTVSCSWRTFSEDLQSDKNVKKRTIKKLLIANRGEIACRVMKTAKK